MILNRDYLLCEYRKLMKSSIYDRDTRLCSSEDVRRVFNLARNLSAAGLEYQSSEVIDKGNFGVTYNRWNVFVKGLELAGVGAKELIFSRTKLIIEPCLEGVLFHVNGYPSESNSSSISFHNGILNPVEINMRFDGHNDYHIESGLLLVDALNLACLNMRRDKMALNRFFANQYTTRTNTNLLE